MDVEPRPPGEAAHTREAKRSEEEKNYPKQIIPYRRAEDARSCVDGIYRGWGAGGEPCLKLMSKENKALR